MLNSTSSSRWLGGQSTNEVQQTALVHDLTAARQVASVAGGETLVVAQPAKPDSTEATKPMADSLPSQGLRPPLLVWRSGPAA